MGADRFIIESFFTRFAQALIERTAFVVGPPLGRDAYATLETAVDEGHAAIRGLEHAAATIVRRWHPAPPVTRVERHTLAFLVALHHTLFVAHAAVARGTVSPGRLRASRDDAARLMAAAGALVAPADALFAHALLQAVVEAVREDHTCVFRVGQRQFYGEEPRWTRSPFARSSAARGGELDTTTQTSVMGILRALGEGTGWRTLFAYAPFSRLVYGPALGIPADLSGLAPVLAERELCRLALHEVLEGGLRAHAAWFVDGFRAWDRTQASTEDEVLCVARFVVTCASWQYQLASMDEASSAAHNGGQSGPLGELPEAFVSLVAAWMERQDLLQLPQLDTQRAGTAYALHEALRFPHDQPTHRDTARAAARPSAQAMSALIERVVARSDGAVHQSTA